MGTWVSIMTFDGRRNGKIWGPLVKLLSVDMNWRFGCDFVGTVLGPFFRVRPGNCNVSCLWYCQSCGGVVGGHYAACEVGGGGKVESHNVGVMTAIFSDISRLTHFGMIRLS